VETGFVKAVLLLEDGTWFEGKPFGARGQRCGEVVFNTSMSGYQEILTDPSYHEQIVTMTYPLIGNYGTNPEDWESRKLFVAGFVVKENCTCPSNWRSSGTLDEYLKKSGIVGIAGIDTRKLVRHIRTQGAMRGILSSTETDAKKLARQLLEYPGLVGRDIVDVTVENLQWKEGVDVLVMTGGARAKYKVVAFDYGIKQNILPAGLARLCGDSGARRTPRMRFWRAAGWRVSQQRAGRSRRMTTPSIRTLWAKYPSSASAWATRSSAWPWAAAPTS
jgi:carbamoyl-phosphate synthase small subunit